MPIEISIDREKDIGQLRFSHPKYADRAYSLYNGFTFTNNTKLELQMYQDKRLDPEATAVLLEINGLPEYFDDNRLYDLFRPFGPLNLCKCVMKDGAFRGTAFIQYFDSFNSDKAIFKLNDYLLDGYKLSVVPFIPLKVHSLQHQQEESSSNNSTTVDDTQHSVDIMNLYIKNLEPYITNQDLSQAFRKFGRIVSARVMTNPATGQSKGYGFVSFSKSEEAAAALREMNGIMLGNKPIVVAYHEPRKGRPNTMIQNNNHHLPNNSFANQQQYYTPDRSQQHIRSANINDLSMDELGINIKDISKSTTLNTTTINLPQRKNSDSVHVDQQATQYHSHFGNSKLSPQFSSSPMSGTSTGRSLASLASGLSIQQPPMLQQQTTVVNIGHNGRPTLRRRGSLESVMTESSANLQRIKLEEAVRKCGEYGKATVDIVDMLLTLKRKERSLCLFNPDFLREKVQLALDALATCNDIDNEEEEVDRIETEYIMRKNIASTKRVSMMYTSSPPQPIYYNNEAMLPTVIKKESKAIPIVAPSPSNTHLKESETTTHLLTKENLLSNDNNNVEITSTLSDKSDTNHKDIESLLNSLEGKPIHEKKQLLGDKLFPLVKSTGTKQAPKVTIYLLDTVDLHELAHIMYDTQTLKARVEDAFSCLQRQ
ncbi:uncharacterized protein BX663DRAFT_503026 [Cokeromyces recurvatus]|uniref:uncharacterized protein n=1 Tax=Cokeromyces recurvatus TaxID=90255 RepID=UPI00221E59C3|nr:uncharacterized protein BX663DRAFT_503026 [Cokeromyces recurvatus]KAI7904631.1 hypothetical protein BX663DRAFT_503026 [Cokeromyces recurvatus]